MDLNGVLAAAGLLIGVFFLFRLRVLAAPAHTSAQPSCSMPSLSVIIPARNEEKHIDLVIQSILAQDYPEVEIIVVDDGSTDGTGGIARRNGVKVIRLSDDEEWTGKSRACYEGYLHSKGKLLLFLDADVRLEPGALKSLVEVYEKQGGIVSVQPYLLAGSLSEKMSLFFYLVGAFALAAAGRTEGMFGACVLVSRKDYEAIGGHKQVKSDVIEDVMLAKRAAKQGISVLNFTGRGVVAGRIYSGGIREVVAGWSKNFPLGAQALSPVVFLLVFIWVCGVIASQSILFSTGNLLFYLLYFVQIYGAARLLGQFGVALPLFHFVPAAFFVFVFLYAVARILVTGSVEWKGRTIEVKSRGMR